ncbi:MAG: hypothetical protein NW217_13575 [Hyphomicrobiaceae bacterium]|nr:hypothetical protein [Hyphomicrobiaceae bacterium]
MTETGVDPATEAAPAPPKTIMTTGWVLKRALAGIAMLTVFVTSFALLLHAAIDPSLEGENSFGETILEAISRIAGKL